MVTASHNPQDYNGIKLVQKGSRPISGDSGLHALRDLVCSDMSWPDAAIGRRMPAGIDYGGLCGASTAVHRTDKTETFAGWSWDPGNGGAGLVAGGVGEKPADRDDPGTLCAGRNLSPGNSESAFCRKTARSQPRRCAARRRTRALPGMEILTAAFSSTKMANFSKATISWVFWPRPSWLKNPGAKIIHDPRLTWNTQGDRAAAGGHADSEQDRACFYQRKDAGRRCRVRRRDVGASLFPATFSTVTAA